MTVDQVEISWRSAGASAVTARKVLNTQGWRTHDAAHPSATPAMPGSSDAGWLNSGKSCPSVSLPKAKEGQRQCADASRSGGLSGRGRAVGPPPMFLLALTAGLRQGELIALKWSDLDTKERTLTITEKRSVERRSWWSTKAAQDRQSDPGSG